MNVLVLGARVIGPALAHDLVRAFLGARFSREERHVRRLAKVAVLETQVYSNAKGMCMMNPLQALAGYGQSPWLDNIRRNLITSGELKTMIEQDGLKGITSNPAIFEKAIVGSSDYADALARALRQSHDHKVVYETLALADLRDAADIMAPVYTAMKRADGYVSLEVSPYLAHDTPGTIAEARRLWTSVGKPNLMIKVPATPEGIPAIRQLISEGINVNVTLLFAVEAYARVAEAYLSGLEALAQRGGDIAAVASVASFFVSRIDALVDKDLARIQKESSNPGTRELAGKLQGKVAIANAKLAYLRFQEIYRGPRWEALAGKGAQKQRLLWASTGTKNPAYRDTLYIEELIGPETVNTIPPATYSAFRDHGRLRASLVERLGEAQETMGNLKSAGIDFPAVTETLLKDGVALFADAFDKLLAAVDAACKTAA
jgi:transaldolase/glucose-6-phosphate isomerase